MTENVNNGSRGTIAIGAAGLVPCGIIERAGTLEIAFAGRLQQLPGARVGETVMIDGDPHLVLAAAASEPAKGGVRGLVVLTVKPT